MNLRIVGSPRIGYLSLVGVCSTIVILISSLAQPLLAQQDLNITVSLQLPPAAIHPLPPSLETWVDPNNTGDYFEQIAPFGFGYLVWSHFPIQVYLNTELSEIGTSPSVAQMNNWRQAIVLAIQEWNQFIPVQVSDRPDLADIIFTAQSPPLRWPTTTQGSSGSQPLPLPRAKTAETTYSIGLHHVNDQMVMKQKYAIQLSPKQSLDYLVATARHELGHALGIWGHSPVQDDVLYFSQVQTPPAISARDINTLKKIYQQPTQLGWPLIASE